jgi:hypothetical protein
MPQGHQEQAGWQRQGCQDQGWLRHQGCPDQGRLRRQGCPELERRHRIKGCVPRWLHQRRHLVVACTCHCFGLDVVMAEGAAAQLPSHHDLPMSVQACVR